MDGESSRISRRGGPTPSDPEIANADAVIVQKHEPTLRGIIRVVATVVASAIALYLIYLLRTPLGWLFVATFVAVSVAAPVRRLEEHMPRGAAIALVYLTLVLIPIGIGADPDPARGHGRKRPRQRPPELRHRPQRHRPEQRHAARPERGLRPRRQARGRRQQRRRLARRRRDDARRHRRRADRLAVRAVHDHRHEHLHGLPRPRVDAGAAQHPQAGGGRGDRQGARADGDRRLELRRRRADAGDRSPASSPSSCCRSSASRRRWRSR